MIAFPAGVTVWIAGGVTDMRCGSEEDQGTVRGTVTPTSIAAIKVQQGLGRDPHGGEIFCFRGRKGDLVKLIWHDGVGMSLYMKRLEAGKFIWPTSGSGEAVQVSAAQIGDLLEQAAERHRSERGREHRLAQSALDAEARKGRIKPCHDVIFFCLRGRHYSLLP